MAWLRIDDRFAFHPKVGELTRADRWTWMEVLCHCAAQRTEGRIPGNITELYRHVTPRFLGKARVAGLVDVGEDGLLQIHDWDVYNGANLPVRIANYLAENPFASANEVYKEVGGKREIVLAIVAQLRSEPQTAGSPGGSQEPKGNQEGTGSGTGSRARASRPPTPIDQEQEQQQVLDESEALHAARAKTENRETGEPAAADLDGPTSQAQVTAALATLKATDAGSFARVAPLAEQLPAQVFQHVLDRVQERKQTGTVKNDVGLLVDLLRTTERSLQLAAAAEQAARKANLTPADEIARTASGYALNELPWDAALELLERRIGRITDSEADREELLEIAQEAFNAAADPEPTVVSTTADQRATVAD